MRPIIQEQKGKSIKQTYRLLHRLLISRKVIGMSWTECGNETWVPFNNKLYN
ncbi:MAG: hypothetical protein SPE11_10800 [Parabacteroides sp.]|nr:hypothetical protein [Parabacteroides sp.]